MSKYCCLSCPKNDHTDKKLTDKCPDCNKEYQFPLINFPNSIRDYKIIEPLSSRGFYSVTYIAEHGNLGKKYVLKVSSKKIYEFFDKDFEKECRVHMEVSNDSEHVVEIFNSFEEDIKFGEEIIPCYVSVLEYINGKSLDCYLSGDEPISARTIAQIGIDLFRIIGDLESNKIHHNDLHGGNILIQQLKPGYERREALDASVRAMVIDLGSVAGESISNEQRLSDIHQVARHLGNLSRLLLKNPEQCEDIEYRLASLLNDRANMLATPSITGQRLPSINESIKDIKETFEMTLSPWKEFKTPKLRRLDDAYNAQTLQPWFVPLLLVDPDKLWQAAVSITGPQVIVGMRGCGKTMLLRSLQFHARATKENDLENIIQKLKDDRYVGLYVSCNKILETHKTDEINEPYARLLIGFALEGLRAITHLKEIVQENKVSEIEVFPSYYRNIAEALSESLSEPEFNTIGSEYELERYLIRLLVLLSTGERSFALKGHPADAFSRLALALKKCASLWSNHYILFLLDDVSTRYLNEERIRNLMSQLIFQSNDCSFKFTTEAQTLELVLKSPGEIESAREGRDYKVFDLGAQVYEKVRGRGNEGKEFVENILNSRARYYPNPPNFSPKQILGDVSLDEIAQTIVTTSESSKVKKQVYWGISALTAVCVGDIGDVISLYELMIRKSNNKKFPIDTKIQSDCYQEFCSRRLYDVHRKEGKLKDFALSFAEASHQLLMESHKKRKKGSNQRLRQYNQIYVRITTGNHQKQFEELRKLIDAGVFILAGGSDTPRNKTRDSDPIQQFILTYRKLFGLGNYIALSQRDRYELSGDQLEEWLEHPERGKEILIENLTTETEDDDFVEEVELNSSVSERIQPGLFINDLFQESPEAQTEDNKIHFQRMPSTISIDSKDISKLNIDEVVVGLGFEDRTPDSLRRILKITSPKYAHLFKYPAIPVSDKIKNLINKKINHVAESSYDEVTSQGIKLNGKNILVDITGLAKPLIFQSIRSALKLNKKVYIGFTGAKTYYPKDEDIENILQAEKNSDSFKLMETVRNILVSGEEGEYHSKPQLQSDADETRRRALCAFASAKHERLLTLLDEREYDQIEIVIPTNDSPKNRIAKLVAKVAASNYPNAGISEVDEHDISKILSYLVERYTELYISKGYNFEIALSGSKLQTVACAALSVAYKLSQCWYVQPSKYDIGKFTTGTGDTKFYEISIPDPE